MSRFERRMKEIAANIPRNLHKGMRKVVLAIDQAVVLSTPVDTGRARANWMVGVGRRPSGRKPAPSVPGQGAAEALEQARAAMSRYNGGDIHITNNLPYIEKLNSGSSRQAPARFVENAVRAGIRAVRGIKVL